MADKNQIYYSKFYLNTKLFLRRKFIFFLFNFVCLILNSQKQANNWYFANNCALTFSSTNPSTLNGCVSNVAGGSGTSVSDENGNLLFYSDGMTVWNSQNLVMPNGSGLHGAIATDQGALAVKQPGANKNYFLFTNSISTNTNATGGFKYSIIDMSLVAGSGSVTTLNIPLLNLSTEKVAATRHCNGIDIWIVTHEQTTNNYLAYLLTSAGINTVPIVSSIGPNYCNSNPCYNGGGIIKFNTHGTQLADLIFDSNLPRLILYNFNKSNGVISNTTNLYPAANSVGLEFSSNGNKLYAVKNPVGINDPGYIFQWNLCAGDSNAINASMDTIGITSTSLSSFANMQLATDNKIYISRNVTSTLAVIHSPNSSGLACNFVEFSQPIGSSNARGLPGFLSNLLQPKYTYTSVVGCSKASFDAPPINCAQSTYISSYLWNFGDPASGSMNTSNSVSPTHLFSSGGTYTVTSIINYSFCAADTIRSLVTVESTPQPILNGKAIICKNESSTISVINSASSYSWNTGANTQSIIVTPSITSQYSVIVTYTNFCDASALFTVTVKACTGIDEFERTKLLISLYPNPFNEEIKVEILVKAKATLIDCMGRVLFCDELNPGTNVINLSSITNGIYMLKLENSHSTNVVKVLKN